MTTGRINQVALPPPRALPLGEPGTGPLRLFTVPIGTGVTTENKSTTFSFFLPFRGHRPKHGVGPQSSRDVLPPVLPHLWSGHAHTPPKKRRSPHPIIPIPTMYVYIAWRSLSSLPSEKRSSSSVLLSWDFELTYTLDLDTRAEEALPSCTWYAIREGRKKMLTMPWLLAARGEKQDGTPPLPPLREPQARRSTDAPETGCP
jgi:hypothetical protein